MVNKKCGLDKHWLRRWDEHIFPTNSVMGALILTSIWTRQITFMSPCELNTFLDKFTEKVLDRDVEPPICLPVTGRRFGEQPYMQLEIVTIRFLSLSIKKITLKTYF